MGDVIYAPQAQYVLCDKFSSKTVDVSTGAPQGCVLSPTLYSLYTNDYRRHFDDTYVLKFADDSSIIGLIDSEENYGHYFEEVHNFVSWCKDNFLSVNVTKTKELVIDFRIIKNPFVPLEIESKIVECVESYKYLGMTLDNELNWHLHISTLCSKLSQRLYFLRKLKTFKINADILNLFYSAMLQSLITFGITCWGGSLLEGDSDLINSIIHKAEKVIGRSLPNVSELYSVKAESKCKHIIKDKSHPLHDEYVVSGRSMRYLTILCKTERYRNTFVPVTSKMLSSSKTVSTE